MNPFGLNSTHFEHEFKLNGSSFLAIGYSAGVHFKGFLPNEILPGSKEKTYLEIGVNAQLHCGSLKTSRGAQ